MRRRARRGAGRRTCTASRPGSPRRARPGRRGRAAPGAPRRRTPARRPRAPVAAIAGTSGRVPSRFEAAVTATSRVRVDSTASRSSSSAVSGSKSSQRTVAPAASAASTQGRMFASWSSRVTTTSSPGRQPRADGAGEVEGQLRHRPPEHDPARVGTEQVRDRRTGAHDDVLGPPLGVGDRAPVGEPRRHRAGDRLGHRRRHLRAARPVEVGHAVVERRELGADAREIHADSVSDLGGAGVAGGDRRVSSGGVTGAGLVRRPTAGADPTTLPAPLTVDQRGFGTREREP